MKAIFFALVLILVSEANAEISNLKLKGDFRYRLESVDLVNAELKQRQRLRARVGLSGEVNSETKVVLRLASGTSSATSTNQTLGSGSDHFSNKKFELDLAFVEHKWSENLLLSAGKVKNPFFRTGKNDLMWDSDLTPEGVALNYSGPQFFARTSWLQVANHSSQKDISLSALQLGIKSSLVGKSVLGVGFYNYSDTVGEAVVGKAFANEVNGSNYAHNYRIAQLFLESAVDLYGIPFLFYGEFLNNTALDSNNDALLFGIKIGKIKDLKSWSLELSTRRVEKEAFIGAFSDADFIGGGTDGYGSRVRFKYQLAKGTTFGVTQMSHRKGIENGKGHKVSQVDFAFKF